VRKVGDEKGWWLVVKKGWGLVVKRVGGKFRVIGSPVKITSGRRLVVGSNQTTTNHQPFFTTNLFYFL
jgi:hypothetical protein